MTLAPRHPARARLRVRRPTSASSTSTGAPTRLPNVQVRHPLRSARALFSSKWFTIGMIVGDRQLGAARGRARARADVGGPGGARGGRRLHRRDGRPPVRLRGRPAPVDRLSADGRRPGAARRSRCRRCTARTRTSPSPAMIAFEAGLFGLGGLLDHGSAHGRPGRAPRRDARRRRRHPLRRLRHRDQGAHRHRRRARRRSALLLSPWLASRCSPRSSPSTPRRAACRTATPSRSSPSPAPPRTSPASPAGSSCSATRWRAAPLGIDAAGARLRARDRRLPR